MTQALCFHCGEIKFGALCPCNACSKGPVGQLELDILFTDHYFHLSTLKQFGSIIRKINAHTAKPEIAFWAFLHYVGERTHILRAAVPEPYREAIGLVESLKLPDVELNDPQGKPMSLDPAALDLAEPRRAERATAAATDGESGAKPGPKPSPFAGWKPVLVESKDGIDYMAMELDASPGTFGLICRPIDHKISPAEALWLTQRLEAKGLKPKQLMLSEREFFEVRRRPWGCGSAAAVLVLAITVVFAWVALSPAAHAWVQAWL